MRVTQDGTCEHTQRFIKPDEKKHSIREIQTKAVMRNHCTPVRMTIIKRQEITRASEGVEKGNPCALLMELY